MKLVYDGHLILFLYFPLEWVYDGVDKQVHLYRLDLIYTKATPIW